MRTKQYFVNLGQYLQVHVYYNFGRYILKGNTYVLISDILGYKQPIDAKNE